ncbi:unnamed protein product [Lathyrus sativus]|nr:unnamed protein product [Lathyrus sativus]
MASVITHRDEETPLVVTDEPPLQHEPHKSHSRDVHIMSLAFLLIFLAYGAAQNLQSTLNTEEDLGTTSLGILYLSFTFFSLFASLVVRILGSKNALIIGTSGYWLYVAANLKPNWYTLVPASVYLGFCASIIWVGQGTYLTSTARSHSIDNNLHEGAVIGDFNGEFWGVYALHQFIGNLITFALLSDGQGGSTKGTTLLFVVFLFVMTFGAILMCFLHKRSGLQQAFVWAEFTKYVVTPAIGVSGVGIAMAAYGAFDGICSLAAGRLTSGLTSITSIVSFGAFAQAVVLILLLLNFSISSGFLGTLYILFLAALLGIGDGVLMTQLNALLGMLFKHDMEGAFAQLKIWQSATIAIVFFVAPYVSFEAVIIVMLVVLCLSFCSFLWLALKVGNASSPSTTD